MSCANSKFWALMADGKNRTSHLEQNPRIGALLGRAEQEVERPQAQDCKLEMLLGGPKETSRRLLLIPSGLQELSTG